MVELWQHISDWVESYLGITQVFLARLAQTLGILIFYFIARKILSNVLVGPVADAHKKFVFKKSVYYVLGILTVLGLIVIWLGGVSGVAAYLGVVSAGFAIAFQDPLVNLAGWLFIAVRRPFVVGDRIQIGEHAGDVIDRRLFQFTIVEIGSWVDADQSTGHVIHIPNGWIFKNSTMNYTQSFKYIWNELPLTVTFESNWERAKELMKTVASEHSAIDPEEEAAVCEAAEQYNIFFAHLRPIVWMTLAENGVRLTIRYLCEPRRRRSTETEIWEDVLRAFSAADDINFAYPTTRFFNNANEGKAGTKTAEA